MRFLVSVDIEGASGVVSGKECSEVGLDYDRARRWLTGDCNAAIEGVLSVDPTATFVLHDTHGLDYRNVILDDLHPAAEVVRGQPVIFFETPDLERRTNAEAPYYDAALLVGMHARSGQPGVVSHVLDDARIKGVWLNGAPAGESHVTIALAAYFGVPTVLVTGDQIVCGEIARWMGGEIETAIVKESYTRYVARCLSLAAARARIREAASRAALRVKEGRAKARGYPAPVALEVELDAEQTARYCGWIPTVTWDGGRRVAIGCGTFLDAYRALLCVFWIAESTLTP